MQLIINRLMRNIFSRAKQPGSNSESFGASGTNRYTAGDHESEYLHLWRSGNRAWFGASHHLSASLKELKNAGLIKGTVEGASICFCINQETWQLLKKR